MADKEAGIDINELAVRLEHKKETIDTSHIRHPQDKGPSKASIFSELLFLWLEPLIFKGWKKGILEQKDLYNTRHGFFSENIHDEFQKHWEVELKKRKDGRKPNLMVPLLKILYWRLILQFILSTIEVTCHVCQSILLGLLTDYFVMDEPTSEETTRAYLIAMATFLVSIIGAFCHAHAISQGLEVGMASRIMTTTAIFYKIFQLKQKTIGETTIGKIVNLASNDVQRYDLAFILAPFVVLAPIHITVTTVLLWSYLGLGPSCLAGLSVLILQMPLQFGMGQLFAKLRFKSAKFTDKRVKTMNEIITGIRVIKMYGWERAFTNVVKRLRKSEVLLVALSALFRAINNVFYAWSTILILLLTLSTYIFTTGNPLTPKIVFTTLGLLYFLKLSSILFLVQSILGYKEAIVASKRISELLTKDIPSVQTGKERRYNRRPILTSLLNAKGEDLEASDLGNALEGESDRQLPERETPSISVENMSATWGKDIDRLTLNGISFDVGMDKRLLAIVGPVGAGKSTILQCLLGELQPLSGSVDIIGTIGYTAQDSWIFSGTIRDNILFGKELDEVWYAEVIAACCLEEDISQLPHGDDTLVGERGVTLSGGQKTRISLARSVYRKADVYILDDPLSAVDVAVGRQLFDKCINGLLSDSVVVLVTHQLQYVQKADAMLVIDKGEMIAYGTYSEIMHLVEKNEENPKNAAIKSALHEMIEHMATVTEKDVFDVDDSLADMGGDSDDETSYLQNNNYSQTPNITNQESISLSMIEDGPQAVSSSQKVQESDVDKDYDFSSLADFSPIKLDTSESLVAFPSTYDLEEKHFETELHTTQKGTNEKTHFGNVVPEEDKNVGSVTIKTYYQYFIFGGGYIWTALLLAFLFIAEGNIVTSEWYLSEWAASDRDCNSNYSSNFTHILCKFSNPERVGIYAGLMGATLITFLIRATLFYFIGINASKVIHNRSFHSVLRAPIRFFDTNPVGRVLNRFSKDLGFMDDVLPYHFYDFVFIMMRFLSIMVVAAVANYFVIIAVVPIIIVFWLLRMYYLKPARDIKRLEAISRSPLFSHISETIQGLATIRACERQKASVAYFHAYQDEQSKGWHTYIAASRWFAVRVDLISSFFIGIVAVSGVAAAGGPFDAALLSLSVAYVMQLAGSFQYGVRLSAEVENLMISVERLLSYGKLESEAPLDTPPGVESPPPFWPDQGAVHFHKMKYRYSKDTPYVLRGITFDIRPAEKVGIVGRTGAGKSSLMQALFRLAEPEGMLTIDGISTTKIGLHDLRQRISIIPQDPILFSGTVRYNLDPFTKYSDDKLWNALSQVELKEVIKELNSQLLAPVTEGGSNFSVGQRQLICLARALLQRNKILVIDEATANVDMKTDAIIQETIRREFVECTTLTIAHRLNTIMDSDRIMVFSAGRLREFDQPHILLQDSGTLLSKMVDNTGVSESERLRKIASEKFYGS